MSVWSSWRCVHRTRSPTWSATRCRTYPAATVTDVGSVKAGVLDALWRRDVDLDRYVGSHPMAGSQHSGPMTARADLFVDRTWVITPHRRSRPAAVRPSRRRVVQACGAPAVVMDVDDHDAAVARVSHLPHLMSVLMAGHLNDVPDGGSGACRPGLARRHPGRRPATLTFGSRSSGPTPPPCCSSCVECSDQLDRHDQGGRGRAKVAIASRTAGTRGSRDAEDSRQARRPPGRV